MGKEKFSLAKRAKSFRHALDGIIYLARNEHNARVHLFVFAGVVLAGFIFHLSAMEWIAVLIVSGAVFTAEAFNTAIEKIADFVCPEFHEKIKPVKDVAAGAVLFTAIAAAITGLLIFIPKIASLFLS